ncbi:MAG: O-antigen ligase family protein [Novosphingobium sp.]|nr:O-antigen ligase family protein [Novosphingobium sp.]
MAAMMRAANGQQRAWIALVGLLIVIFLTGGGSRADISSLPLLRGLAALALWYGLWGFTKSDLRSHSSALGLAGLTVLLVVSHITPLPPSVWQALPERDLIVQIDTAAGLGDIWRPLSMDPVGTVNALHALIVPCAVMILCTRLSDDQLDRLPGLLLVLAGASAIIAVLQGLGDPNGPLYLYQVTNNGVPVGLFANRNHQAVLMAIILPLLAAWHALADPPSRGTRKYLSIGIALFIIPLVLVTGSRAGLLTTVIAAISVVLLVQRKTSTGPSASSRQLIRRSRSVYVPSQALILAVAVLLVTVLAATVIAGRDEAIDRLINRDTADEMRLLILPTMKELLATHWLLGTGFGSFEAVYKVHEPDSLLFPTYMNHAHNDWLELILNGGVPAGGLVVVLAAMLLRRAVQVFKRDCAETAHAVALARLGMIVIGLLLIASIGDYPLRTPIMASIFAIALILVLRKARQPLPDHATS